MKNENKENKKNKSKLLDMDGFEIVQSKFLGNHKVVKHGSKPGDHINIELLD